MRHLEIHIIKGNMLTIVLGQRTSFNEPFTAKTCQIYPVPNLKLRMESLE